METIMESQQERSERIRRHQLASFEEGVRYHLANGPETWRVVKKAERLWYVVNASGDMVMSGGTKRKAEDDRVSGPYVRIWRERDEWYRGTSRDPRNRQFTDDERAVLDRLYGGDA